MRARSVSRIPVVLASLFALAVAPCALAQAPPNDAFASAQALAGESGAVSGTNLRATKEPGEPEHAGNEGGASVWYRWTAPLDGAATFETRGNDFDTLLAVYRGAMLTALTVVDEDDDSGADALASRVSFRTQAGAEYAIAVDGYEGEVGRFDLRWTRILAPSNDDFDRATILAGGQGRVRGTLAAATREAGERHGRPSVWFRWTAPRAGRVAFAARGPVAAVVAYSGSSLATLDRVASAIGAAPLAFSAAAGTTYTIAVTGDDGDFTLLWGPPPANDNFRAARTIARVRGRTSGSNVLATREEREPAHYGRAHESVWYRWRAPRTGRTLFTTRGSRFDTVLAAYVGPRLGRLRRLASSDDAVGLASTIRFRAVRGVVYRIAVDGFGIGDVGRISLSWRRESTPLTGRH